MTSTSLYPLSKSSPFLLSAQNVLVRANSASPFSNPSLFSRPLNLNSSLFSSPTLNIFDDYIFPPTLSPLPNKYVAMNYYLTASRQKDFCLLSLNGILHSSGIESAVSFIEKLYEPSRNLHSCLVNARHCVRP